MEGAPVAAGVLKKRTFTKAIFKRDQIIPFFDLMRSERVALIGIGDSNQILSGHGVNHGWHHALSSAGFRMWGTGIVSANENNGSGTSAGMGYAHLPFKIGYSTGAPAELDKYFSIGQGTIAPGNYAYLADNASFANNNNGFSLSTVPINLASNLEWGAYYGTFPSGTAQMRLGIRIGESPFTTLAQGNTINPVTGSYGISSTTLLLPAAARGYVIQGQVYNSVAAVPLDGPAFLTYQRWIDRDMQIGYSYQDLDYHGGVGFRNMAKDLQQASTDYLTHYISAVREPLGANKAILFTILSGVNDRNETLASLGPQAVADGDSPEAYVDNVDAIITRLLSIFDNAGWSTSNVYFLIIPSPIVSSPDDAELVSYRLAIDSVAINNQKSAIAHFERLMDYSEMTTTSNQGCYYAATCTDFVHFVASGYERMYRKLLQAILSN